MKKNMIREILKAIAVEFGWFLFKHMHHYLKVPTNLHVFITKL